MKRIAMLPIFVFSVSLLASCGSSGNNPQSSNPVGVRSVSQGDTAWTFEKTIRSPITGKTGSGSDLRLGDLAKDKVSVVLPGGATDQAVDIHLSNPDSVPKVFGKDWKTIGAPIEVGGAQPMRLNKKAIITFAFDPAKLPEGTASGSLRVVYYDGSQWSSIRPDAVDMSAGTVTFSSYHFSMLGINKIDSTRKVTEEWIHSKTLDDEIRKKVNKMSDHVANQIIDLTLQNMGINDKSLSTKIFTEVAKEDLYKEIYDNYDKGDTTVMSQKIAILAGKKIAQLVPASKFKDALNYLTKDSNLKGGNGGFTSAASDVEAVAKAAGFAAEGRYEDAAKIIGSKIIDKFVIGKVGKIAVDVVNYEIGAWKNSEVEAAYNAYKDGANGKFWGYNVDKGDFNGIWDQMRGIRRQLELEAIEKQNQARKDVGLPPLTEEQSDMVREALKESFRRQFAAREKKEEEFKKTEETMKRLIEGFDKAGFFGITRPKGLEKGLDYEGELDVLYHFAKKIMRDTKRGEISDLNGLTMQGKISVDDIVQGARYWFSGPDGQKEYAKFLKDRFKISLAPNLSDLAGSWVKGSVSISDVKLSGKALQQSQAGKGGSGDGELCDLNIDWMSMKGKSSTMDLSITANGSDAGLLKMKFKDGGLDPVPFTYSDGIIIGSMKQKEALITLEMTISDEGTAYDAAGNLKFSIPSEGIEIFADLKATKSKPTPAIPLK